MNIVPRNNTILIFIFLQDNSKISEAAAVSLFYRIMKQQSYNDMPRRILHPPANSSGIMKFFDEFFSIDIMTALWKHLNSELAESLLPAIAICTADLVSVNGFREK